MPLGSGVFAVLRVWRIAALGEEQLAEQCHGTDILWGWGGGGVGLGVGLGHGGVGGGGCAHKCAPHTLVSCTLCAAH